MPSPYFTQGTKNEQYILEDLIVESISIYGQEMLYIPRQIQNLDEILGEDRLSRFRDAWPIDVYLENATGFEGQGAFIQKFGLFMEQTATLTVARRTWQKLIGVHPDKPIPNRPSEGDLLYFPLTNGLFEIKFVQHQDPFYQLRKLYVYKLEVELFQYASERIDTGMKEVDIFETLKSHDVGDAVDIDQPQHYGNNNNFKQEADSFLFNANNPFGDVVTSPLIPTGTADSMTETTDSGWIKSDRKQ